MEEYGLGLLFGDGVAHRNIRNRSYAIWIDQHEKNLDILEELERIFIKEKIKFYKYKVPENKIRIYSCSKERYLILKEVKENVVDYFKKLNIRGKKKFIAGFFDAEGTVTDRLVVYNKNKKLLEEMKKFLETLDVIGHIYKFPKVFGLQIYRKHHVHMFKKHINSVKLSRAIQPGKKRSQVLI